MTTTRTGWPAMPVAVVTGGRDYFPSLAELELLAAEVQRRGIEVLREGEARGVDKTVAGYLRARQLCTVEPWPADWQKHENRAGPIRNRAMLDGEPRDLLGNTEKPGAEVLFAFPGGRGTHDCCKSAHERGIEVARIEPVDEPRIWNMHHGRAPGPLMYVGRSPQWGGPSPLGNPLRLEPGTPREEQVERVLGGYRTWLGAKIKAGDRDVLSTLDAITPATFLGCTCWPRPCHAEVIVRAWRWRQTQR